MEFRLPGFIAAVHSPFHNNGNLALERVEPLAHHLISNDVLGVFVCGTTGESLSLTLAERMALLERWSQVAAGRLRIVAHVGATSQRDAITLAQHAGDLGVDAISTMAPCFFKPATARDLADFCAPIAAAASETPFYYYDIPSFTGVNLPMVDFLEEASAWIPTLVGLKYSNGNLIQLQQLLELQDGRFDILYGSDETLLAAWALGVRGAIGSTYNFAAPLYHRMLEFAEAGEMKSAQIEQRRSVALVDRCVQFGAIAGLKEMMSIIGLDQGPTRSPVTPLKPEQSEIIRAELAEIGFFDWAIETAPQDRFPLAGI